MHQNEAKISKAILNNEQWKKHEKNNILTPNAECSIHLSDVIYNTLLRVSYLHAIFVSCIPSLSMVHVKNDL